ncbi:hypothetical protein ACFL96_02935 [Thermoproteota archaeon]
MKKNEKIVISGIIAIAIIAVAVIMMYEPAPTEDAMAGEAFYVAVTPEGIQPQFTINTPTGPVDCTGLDQESCGSARHCSWVFGTCIVWLGEVSFTGFDMVAAADTDFCMALTPVFNHKLASRVQTDSIEIESKCVTHKKIEHYACLGDINNLQMIAEQNSIINLYYPTVPDGNYTASFQYSCGDGFCEDGICVPAKPQYKNVEVKLKYGQAIANVPPSYGAITSTELPWLLQTYFYSDNKGANFNVVEYAQKILFNQGKKGQLIFSQDQSTDEELAGTYLLVKADSQPFYNLSIRFFTPVAYDAANADDDMVGTKLRIHGTDYTINDTEVALGSLSSLTLNDGSKEIKLRSGMEVQVNGMDIDGSSALLAGPAGQLHGIFMMWGPDSDIFVADNGRVSDPIFDSFYVRFSSFNPKMETMRLSSSGNNAEFEFEYAPKKQVEIPFNAVDNQIRLGYDYESTSCDGRLLIDGMSCTAGSTREDIEGVMFLLVTSSGVPHVMEIANIDSQNRTELHDITTGKNYENKVVDLEGRPSELELGPLGTIVLTLDTRDDAFINASSVNHAPGGYMLSKNGAKISLNPYAPSVTIIEEESDTGSYRAVLGLLWDSTDAEIDLAVPRLYPFTGNPSYTVSGVSDSDVNRDLKHFVTYWGTHLKYDSDDKKDVEILYPNNQAEAVFWISPVP